MWGLRRFEIFEAHGRLRDPKDCFALADPFCRCRAIRTLLEQYGERRLLVASAQSLDDERRGNGVNPAGRRRNRERDIAASRIQNREHGIGGAGGDQ